MYSTVWPRLRNDTLGVLVKVNVTSARGAGPSHAAAVMSSLNWTMAALSLIALAYVRLGIPPEQHERFRDLDDARLLVDALGGMLVATEGRLGAPEASLRDALANLRMTFADVSAHLEAHPDGDPADEDDPEDSGILRPPSGLWVPGQD